MYDFRRFLLDMTENKNQYDRIREKVAESGLSHIAFIMDGNGRWATSKGLPREVGHRHGAENFKKIVRMCGDVGIDAVTVYAFSTENWKRPSGEVNAIMRLLDSFIKDAERENEENRIRYVFLGDKSALAPALAQKCTDLENLTVGNRRLLNIALNYGGRAEIVSAVNALLAQGRTSVTEADISSHIYTSHCSDPDLIVRTGKELRTSNFLPWQTTYSEYYFTDVLWPDFSPQDIEKAIHAFNGRNRRFGGVKP